LGQRGQAEVILFVLVFVILFCGFFAFGTDAINKLYKQRTGHSLPGMIDVPWYHWLLAPLAIAEKILGFMALVFWSGIFAIVFAIILTLILKAILLPKPGRWGRP
jgi:hypothetical protein